MSPCWACDHQGRTKRRRRSTMTSLARHMPERSPSRDPPVRRAADRPKARRRHTTHRCHHEAQLDGRYADSGRTGAGDAEPPLSRRARRRARCLARRTRSLCHLTGLRSPRPTTATVTPHRTTSVRTASTTPVPEGARRPGGAIRRNSPRAAVGSATQRRRLHHDRISGVLGHGRSALPGAGYRTRSSCCERSVLRVRPVRRSRPGIRSGEAPRSIRVRHVRCRRTSPDGKNVELTRCRCDGERAVSGAAAGP